MSGCRCATVGRQWDGARTGSLLSRALTRLLWMPPPSCHYHPRMRLHYVPITTLFRVEQRGNDITVKSAFGFPDNLSQAEGEVFIRLELLYRVKLALSGSVYRQQECHFLILA